ncbi:MAG: ROK family protein [Acetobacteraceae bacterium]|nr:ROK family protein [Acetobacteraceae bacterium]
MSHAASGQGGNSIIVRQYNERVILSALRRLGEASKADLARQASLTQNTAGQIVRELELQKLVRSVGKRSGARGQPATMLRLDPDGAYSIGVKLGRRSTDALLVDFSGNVLEAHRQERVFPRPDEALNLVLAEIEALRGRIPITTHGRLAGVGLAMPYNLGSWRRELGLSRDLCAAWAEFDLAAELRKRLDVSVFVENDGTAVAVAELFGGLGREFDDFVSVFIGTAIGGGLVLRGECRQGATSNAGDIGLMPTSPSLLASSPPPERPSELLLTRASVGSLIRHLDANGVRAASRAELEAAISGHPALVGEWIEDCADALVNPLLSIASVLDVEAIVINGDLPPRLIDQLLRRLETLLAQAAPEARQPPKLRFGTVGRNAAALGAAILPFHFNYSPVQQILFGTGA